MRRPRGAHLASLILLAAAVCAAAAEPENLVANGDFSQAGGGKPDRWQCAGDAGVTQTLAAARDADGRPYAQLICTHYEHRSPASHAMLCQVGGVRLAKGRTYEFSCRMRTEGIAGRAVSVSLPDTKAWTETGLRAEWAVGNAWRTYRRIFRATADVGPTGRLQIWFAETGTLYVADVRIVEVRLDEADFTDVLAPVGGKNLVANGSFEIGPAGWTSMGTGAGWGDLATLHGTVETAGGAAHGRAFLRIPLGGSRTPVLYFDYYEPVVRRELRPLAAGLGWIPVEKGAAYTLSCDLRASRDGAPAVLGVHSADPARRSSDHQATVKLTTAWKRYSCTFRADHRYVFPMVGPNLDREDQVDVDVDAVQLEKGERATDFEPRAAVEFALEPSEPGGIFVDGRPASLHLRACNPGPAPARATVKFEVTDFEDRPVAWPAAALDLAPGAAADRQLPVPADWRGYYRVRAAADAAGRQERLRDVRLAIVPPRTAGDSVCGINHAFASAYLIHQAAKAGVAWYRDWSLKWQHIEPTRGEFRWEVADAQIDRVLKEGAHVVCLLPPFPSADWSSEAPPGLPTTGYPGVRLRQAWGPKDPADLAAFIGKAVARYRDRIHVWEFLNEPIYTDYALPRGGARQYGGRSYGPADYVALLRPAAAAMHRADPGCRVVGGIASGPGNLTREVVEAGCLECVDIFNLHMYPGSRAPEGYASEMDGLATLMDAHGGRKSVWVTEFSYYGADDLPRRPFIPDAGNWAEERLLENERQCADFTVRFFAVMLARGVEKVFIHSGTSPRANQPDFECALLAAGGAPRKLFPALAVFTELVGERPACAGDRRLGKSGWAVAFETAGRSVLVLWQADEGPAARIAAAAAAGMRRTDAMGRTLADGPVALSSSPVYLVGPAGKAKELLESLQLAVEENKP
jgi:hypothetical protein